MTEKDKPAEKPKEKLTIRREIPFSNNQTGEHIYRTFKKGETLEVDEKAIVDFDLKSNKISTAFANQLKAIRAVQ